MHRNFHAIAMVPLWWMLVLVFGALGAAHIPPEQYRHEQLTAMHAAFSRFSDGDAKGSIDRQELPEFLQYVVTSMNSAATPRDEISSRSAELMQQLIDHMPSDKQNLSLEDLLQGTEKILVYPQPADDEQANERGRLGACSALPLPPCRASPPRLYHRARPRSQARSSCASCAGRSRRTG